MEELQRNILTDKGPRRRMPAKSTDNAFSLEPYKKAAVKAPISSAAARRFTFSAHMTLEKLKKPIQPEKKQLDLRPITIPLATNVNNRLKQYANFLFECCDKVKETGMYKIVHLDKHD